MSEKQHSIIQPAEIICAVCGITETITVMTHEDQGELWDDVAKLLDADPLSGWGVFHDAENVKRKMLCPDHADEQRRYMAGQIDMLPFGGRTLKKGCIKCRGKKCTITHVSRWVRGVYVSLIRRTCSICGYVSYERTAEDLNKKENEDDHGKQTTLPNESTKW